MSWAYGHGDKSYFFLVNCLLPMPRNDYLAPSIHHNRSKCQTMQDLFINDMYLQNDTVSGYKKYAYSPSS